MTLQSSGSISLSQVQAEYGGSNPIGMNEYYRNGSHVNAYTAYQYTGSSYAWYTYNNTNGQANWNGSSIGSGMGNSTSKVTGNYTYQRGSLQSTINVKGTTTRIYQIRRKYSGSANNNVPTSGSISMNDFYGGVGSD